MCTPGGGAATAKGTKKLAPKNFGGIPSANAKVLFLPTTIRPPCQWPGPCFFFREGGSIGKGGHVSSFEGGGPLTRARGVH